MNDVVAARKQRIRAKKGEEGTLTRDLPGKFLEHRIGSATSLFIVTANNLLYWQFARVARASLLLPLLPSRISRASAGFISIYSINRTIAVHLILLRSALPNDPPLIFNRERLNSFAFRLSAIIYKFPSLSDFSENGGKNSFEKWMWNINRKRGE